MAAPEPIESIVDLDSAGDALPDLIERAARAGRPLVVERRGVRLAVLVPERPAPDQKARMSKEEALVLLDELGAAFADLTDEEIERETENAVERVRAEMRGEDPPTSR